MVKNNWFNSIILSALICIILIYSNLIHVKVPYKINSLISPSDATYIEGELISSPIKLSNNKFYSCQIKVNTLFSNRIRSSAFGTYTILIPVEDAEVFLPGKLTSVSKQKRLVLWETGLHIKAKVIFGNNLFIISKVYDSFWSKNLKGKYNYFRALGRIQFKRLMYSWGKAGSLFLALLCGSKEYLSSSISVNFRKSGLSHILALSGMHLSLFSGIAVFIGNKIKRIRFQYMLRIIVIILFVWFAGLSPSLLRAFICSLILIFSSLINIEKPQMLFVLCLSFLIQTIIKPEHLTNAGFLLSYGALAGILLLNQYFARIFIPYIPLKLGDSLSASFSAQIFTAPISLKLFGSVYPIGIIASVLVSPIVTIFIYSGLVLFIITLIFPNLIQLSDFFMNLLYTIINFLVGFFSKFPGIIINL